MREAFQSAYRALRTTETVLQHVFNDIIVSLESGNFCLLTLLDISAVFDTIDHDILLERPKSNSNISESSFSGGGGGAVAQSVERATRVRSLVRSPLRPPTPYWLGRCH